MALHLKICRSRRGALKVLAATVAAGATAVWGDTFQPFPNTGAHNQAAVLAAGADVPLSAGTVYNAGNSNDIQVVNFKVTIYTGPVDVTTTITRIRDNQSVYLDESDDGGFFNFESGELPNVPRMGMNYYMEFMVWPAMNLTANTFDTTATPYNSGDSFPGPQRILVGSAGEVYYTGDHYKTSDNVNPTAQPAAITVNSWNTTSDDWSVSGDWSSSHVPAAGEAAYLAVNDDTNPITTPRVVNYDYTGSPITLGDLLVNSDGQSTKIESMTLMQTLGTITTQKEEISAHYASATVNQSAGTDTVLGALHIGEFVSSTGTYLLSGGSLSVADEYIGSTELIAAAGTGTFTQSGGVHTVSDILHLGFAAGGTGTYTLSAGTLNAATIAMDVGGTFHQSGGTLSYTNFNEVGGSTIFDSATTLTGGTFAESGGTFTAPSIQLSGAATLNVTGGSISVGAINNAGSFSVTKATLTASGNATNSGTFTDGASQTWVANSTFTNTAGTAEFDTDVGSSSTTPLAMSATGGKITFTTTQHLNALSLSSGGTVVFNNAVFSRNPLYISTGSLSFGGSKNGWSGLLDLAKFSMIVHNGDVINLPNQLKEGFNAAGGGYWNGAAGIISSTAAGDTRHLTTLGYRPGGISLDGVSTLATDLLVKYTYYGDADLNGSVNGADYALIDTSFGTESNTGVPISGWVNGDFNYDGVVDGSDFSLIDNTFNQITATGAGSLALVATPTALFDQANVATVPEPMLFSLLGLGAIGYSGRRRARR